jgi:methionine-rich copper-binding protein CopC
MTNEYIIAYLLEELPEEESERFETECFAQESWPAQINLVEEDLIDAYLRDELSQERRRRFEQYYLTTAARQERVVMASAFLRHIDEQTVIEEQSVANEQPAVDEHPTIDEPPAAATTKVEPPPAKLTLAERFRLFWGGQSLALRTAMALAAIAIIGGAVWFSLLRTPRPRTFATLTLTNVESNRAEGAPASKVKLPLGVDALRIYLTLPERLPPRARFRVEWENVDGAIKPLEIAGQDARSVSVVIPAAQLTPGQYALNLFVIKTDGTELPVSGSYFFIVE